MQPSDTSSTPSHTTLLSLEFGACFVGFPALLALLSMQAGVFIWLWFISLICMYWLHKYQGWVAKDVWKASRIRSAIRRILYRFVPIAIVLLIFTWWHDEHRLFDFPRQNPVGWAVVMLLYPLMSVVPQEIIFRSFIHRRYAQLFTSRTILIITSGLTFGWVHIVMNNWIAVVFSAIGGIMFADTYERTRSLAAACLEHSLYGCYVFTIGLGTYFYHAGGMH